MAPAKVNLALHVTGQREDGYHLLDTLVAFTDFGDRIVLTLCETPRATVSGPFSVGLAMDGDNLVCRAEALWRAAVARSLPPVHLHLTKNLPIASGIGGGSADAAATLLGLQDLFDLRLPPPRMHDLALSLGADVPMCLAATPLLASGIGEVFSPVAMGGFAIVLVNPGIGVSTPSVFSSLETKTNPRMAPLPASPRIGVGIGAWIDWLGRQRNDLEPPARAAVPEIDLCLQNLAAQTGCKLARMSGSGATCFGLFDTDDNAQAAAAAITRNKAGGWWVQAGRTT